MSVEQKTIVLENTARRDALIDIEKKYQKIWKEEKINEINAPSFDEVPHGTSFEELHASNPKHFSSMAYPYLNGVLHAGHSFTLSKVEFSTGFERMNGKRASFPLGFHCTGMPIRATADKLAREIEQFGIDFSGVPAEDESSAPEVPKEQVKREDVSKFTAKKSKVQAKQGRGKYQFEIMRQLGIPEEEIPKFADPNHWLYYFPELIERDVTQFGARVDWRRSMVTTDANPYYDAFVRWQMRSLKDLEKIKFGERYTIYSVKDGQACMDHDRSSGEGVLPQEYTGIKIEALDFAPKAKEFFESEKFDYQNKKVYFIAATLRPETMIGQTCCFVSPKINYGVFDAGEGNYYICTERAFKNMSYQKLTPKRGYYKPEVVINGKDLIGTKIHAPLAKHQELRILPMETVLATKGTGVVTCVPSDSPDDYVTQKELFAKPEYYGIEKEWAAPELVPIIKTEKYGEKTAEFLVNEFKIQSSKDALQLSQAKELAYKEGFYNGTMILGKYAGEKVEVAKPKVKADLIKSGEAFVYNEPEGPVTSRSGDDCIVSLEDQWYSDYGEESWKKATLECLNNMNVFTTETRNAFEGTLGWLNSWALSRTYGLGTKIPWDEKYLVESLSDSTIYQSYYTIARLLHTDYYGKNIGPLGIKAEEMTDEVFDFIFCRTDQEPKSSTIPREKLLILQREFEYFYPLDVSISGKDLIGNHLTFFIYVHVALFPKKFWPKGIRVNGHLLLNNAKMSKSTGNFMTLQQVVEKFGADASRIALADAGDGLEDANFEESSANAAILRLFNLKTWIEEVVANIDNLRTGEFNFFDLAFENEMNALIEESYKEYLATNYKNALKSGLFDFQTARDFYRDSVSTEGLHKDLILRYIEAQILLLQPVTPHFSEYVYREILNHKESAQFAPFPRANKPVSKSISDSLEYVRDLARSIRETEGAILKKKKGKPVEVDVKTPVKLSILISASFPEWQEKYIDIVREAFESHSLNDNNLFKQKVGKDMKRAMPFISILKQRLATESPETVFNRELSFNEIDTVKSVLSVLKKSPAQFHATEIQAIAFDIGSKVGKDIVTGEDVELEVSPKILESAVPGQPGIVIKNI